MRIILFEIFTVLGEIVGGDAKQICYLSKEFERLGNSVEVLNLHFKDKLFIRDIKFIAKFFKFSDKVLKADVIYASGTPFWALPTYFLGKKIKAPTVLYITHCNSLKVKFIESFSLSKIAMREGGVFLFLKSIINNIVFLFLVAPDAIKSRLFIRFSLKRINKIIFSCHYIKDEIGRLAGENKEIEVIYPLVENVLKYPNLSDKSEITTIFYFGAFYSGRGVIDLLYAFMRIKNKFSNLKLIIAGYPKYEQSTEQIVRKMIERYGFSSCVELLGYQVNILEYLQRVSIVCLPFHDGVLFQPPLTLLEALKMGKCVISTDTGATREFIIDGENGFLVKPRNIDMLEARIDYLIKNPHIIKIIGENAKIIIERQCNSNSNIERIVDILKKATSNL